MDWYEPASGATLFKRGFHGTRVTRLTHNRNRVGEASPPRQSIPREVDVELWSATMQPPRV